MSNCDDDGDANHVTHEAVTVPWDFPLMPAPLLCCGGTDVAGDGLEIL